MTDPNAIPVQPIVDALQPLINAVIVAVVTAIVAAILGVWNQWKARLTQEDAEQRAQDAEHAKIVAAAVANEAGKIVAESATAEFKNKSFTLGSPEITKAADSIIGADAANLRSALNATGVTPELVSSMVLGKIGELQAAPTVIPSPAAGH